MEVTMVPSQFLSVVLEEDNASGSEEESQNYPNNVTWQNNYPSRSNSNSISDQEMWNLTKNLPKALLAECTVEISRTPIKKNEKARKPCFDAKVSPVFSKPVLPMMPQAPPIQQWSLQQSSVLPPPPQLLHRSEWMEERMDVQDLLTGVEAVYSDNESGEEYEEAASVSIFPITISKSEKIKHEKGKKQDLNKFSYPCEHCPNVYSNRGALWQHSVATHSVEKTCECKICGRKFYRNCSLALHLKSHSEEEYCQCKECGKSFNRLANLERHMKVHVDAEQFPCPNCDKIFRDKANLLRHAVVHTTPKGFQCDVCNKSFKTQDNLEVHYRATHVAPETSLVCAICGEAFMSVAELMQHDVTHSSDHLCKVCGQTFPDKTVLKKHLATHTGERLTCLTCGIDFTQKSSLLRHVKRMHQQDSDESIDPREGFSDNGYTQDVDQEEDTESNSTVELRKALGTPIKSGALSIIDPQQFIETNRIISDNHKTNYNSIEMIAATVMNNNIVEGKNSHLKTVPNMADKMLDITMTSTSINLDVIAKNQNSKEYSDKKNISRENKKPTIELNQELLINNTHVMLDEGQVDIRPSHSTIVKIES